ncbi:PREDICTED: ileal sodium/bile acid cotransporter isoform X1 [Polistes canadensis]|uniref:ileal sodium/bile acid cotransporter isoform X1 n=3 Tax=Polistes canadensis TaxID=91411 RepID=UPI000718E866|nr:PREDICTED: ileal sodium/bile acid cotransporter isoform X1 [Polistes canadensis]
MLILITWFFFLHRILAEQSIVEEWSVNVTTSSISVTMEETKTIPFFVVINSKNLKNLSFNYVSTSPDIATVTGVITSKSDNYWNGTLNITGIFLGTAKIKFQFVRNNNTEDKEVLFVTVMRYQGVIDKIFTASVGILVSILYINFGCAMDWDACRKTLRKPVGPAIGCFCQFFFMPLLSYGIGYCLFPDQPELQIGMFFTGISPSGGASNVWTVMLDGNLNLSVTMTTLCTILAFGFMPFWLFTLGKHIFDRGELGVPYDHVAMFAVGLIFPLLIGFCIQKKLPKVCKFMIKIIKPLSAIFIIFIIIFAIFTHLYLFQLFSWRIIVAGMGLPWLGFIFGMLVALIFKQSRQDIIAIAIETGIQNTGVAIFLLRLSLKSPADDLTTVLPVSSAIMTPIPLTILYLLKVIFNCRRKHQKVNNTSESLENSESYAEPTSVVQSN